MKPFTAPILTRGGGDLATGVALRLHRAGLKVLVSELPQPVAVRRSVSFAEAVYAGKVEVEGVTARLIEEKQILETFEADEIPVLVDPNASILTTQPISIVVDARMAKLSPDPLPVDISLHIGLGPGFYAGRNCNAVIETRRSHTLGRVYWKGATQPNSGQPEGDIRRVLYAPSDGEFMGMVKIGDHVDEGQIVAEVSGEEIRAPFPGVVRGLIHSGLQVKKGLKIGDIDPRDNPALCNLVSDKAMAIGGGVLEAILSNPRIQFSIFFNEKTD